MSKQRHVGLVLSGVVAFAFCNAIPLQAAKPADDLSPDPARVQAIAAMLAEGPQAVGRQIGDRAAWEALGSQPVYRGTLDDANKLLKEALPETTDDLYLETSRTGNRTKWQHVNGLRRARFDRFALAECIENKGRFMPAFKETLGSLCAERTWVMPAHDLSLKNFRGEAMDIDLASAAIAWSLATADAMLGERLDASSRQLIRDQVHRRVLDPFREMVRGKRKATWWLTGTNNWNSVCLAGVTGAALALIDSREERAFYVASAEKLSRYFRSGIGADGYCSEGVGYWNYGFGHYVMLAETILRATRGRLDLLQGEHVRRIAMYGLNIEIVPGVYPSFSDCQVTARAGVDLVGYIARRWGLAVPPRLLMKEKWAAQPLFQTMLYAFGDGTSASEPAEKDWPGPGLRTWFDEAQVLIGRPGSSEGCRLAVAMKGGHNAEQHNHNDVGSYIVVLDGQAVLVDPGSEVYTARTFSPHRYDSKVINSFGHSVPMIAGQLQRTGREARARVVRTAFTPDTDTLVIDFGAAYNVPDMEKIERTFVYSRRDGGSLTVTDEATFKTPQEFETALVTFGRWREVAAGKLLVKDGSAAIEVSVSIEGGKLAVHAEEIHEDLTVRQTPTRIGLAYVKPTAHARISVKFRPSTAKLN